MSDKNRLNGYYQAALFTAVIGIIVLAIVSISLSTGYNNALEDVAYLEERYEESKINVLYLDEQLNNVVRERDSLKAEIFAKPLCKKDEARIEYLEGQLDSCNRAYSEEKHDRKFYQNALENVSPYCSEGLDQLVIAGLKDELQYCSNIVDRYRKRYLTEPRYDLVEQNLCDADAECSVCAVMTTGDYRFCFDNAYSSQDLRGAPCHPHPDGIHCGWEPCNMLYDCAFGELGWIGPDREMCDAFGNTRYNEARSVCFSNRNCSSCIQMTGGDLGHCYAFAYYP